MRNIKISKLAAIMVLLTSSIFDSESAFAEVAQPATAEDDTKWINLLENGLERWVVEGNRSGKHIQPLGVWTVSEDGALHCDGRGFGFLRYDEELSDFRFQAEYQIPERGNSGIGLRGVPYDNTLATRPSRAAYELQILDGDGDDHLTGNMALYKLFAPIANPAKAASEWNAVEVLCSGTCIQVWLNGVLVQDVDQAEHPKVRQRSTRGYLQLQNHHCPVAFRNLRLLLLD